MLLEKASPVVYPTVCCTVHQRQQRQQQQQQHDERLESTEDQPGEPSIPQQSIARQPIESGSSTAVHFSLAQPTDSFDIGSADSEGNGSQPDVSDVDADDEFWLSELHGIGAESTLPTDEVQRGSPSGDGGRPAKRHRPG